MRKVSLDTDRKGNDRISDIIPPVYGSSVDHVYENRNVHVQTGVCSEERYIKLSEPVMSTISTAITVLYGAVVCAVWQCG